MTDNDQVFGAGVTAIEKNDWQMLHYAAGILLGLGRKYGTVDVTIYHNDIRVKIEPGMKKATEREIVGLIQQMLDGVEWDVGMLDRIAELLNSNGYKIHEPDGG